MTTSPKAITMLISLVQRLATTIPSVTTSTKSSSTTTTAQLISQLISNMNNQQSIQDLAILTIIVVIALEILNKLVYHVPYYFLHYRRLKNKSSNENDSSDIPKGQIPVRGKHLDNFTYKDYAFITINKCMTGLFVYCYFGYLWSVRKIDSHHEDSHHHGHHDCCNKHGGNGIFTSPLTIQNTLLPLPLLFIIYDFFYTLLHWALHLKSIYAYVHKHHHYQKAPSRANIDAVNVHPLEFFLGEFNHVWALHLVVKGFKISLPFLHNIGNQQQQQDEEQQQEVWALFGYHGMDVSWLCAVLFIGLGGVLAGLNHTRHDVVLSVPSSSSVSSASALTSEDATSDNTTASNSDGSNSNSAKAYYTIFDSKHHDVHHRIPQSNYGQYTVFWDRIFGTFRDYDVNDRVNPLYQLDPLTGKTLTAGVKPKSL
jgi:sterol desaturase/sphingolipid hydroxylase (fatty acid hydroxylase superfamily)